MLTKKQIEKQDGQTLIETLVAAFILTMGISAALGLATYSLHATSNIKQRIIAIGLAREGIEAVKNMRDTNWLRDTMAQDCYNFQAGEFNGYKNANCYRNWLTSFYDIRQGDYYLSFDGNSKFYWELVPSTNRYGLDYSESDVTKGFYSSKGNDVLASNSGFGRAITITETSDIPFNQDTGPRLTVTSNVWWSDQNCPPSNEIPTNAACRVTLSTYLTNWKTFSK